MPIELTMPRLSDTMQAGTVVKWNVKEGQRVKSGDVIADIETDKATMELPTYDDGVIALLAAPEGKQVAVGTLIAVIASGSEDHAAVKASFAGRAGGSAPVAASVGKVETPRATVGATATMIEAASSNGGGRVFASPLAKKIAEETGVDLARIQGTGPAGRIVRRDVEMAISAGAPAALIATAPARPAAAVPMAASTLTGRTVALSNMRRVIARRLVESKQTIPHYQVTVDVDMDALMALRGQLNDQLAGQGVKLSVNDFLVRACALSMHQHPYVNSRWVASANNESIELVADVNVGVAIALPEERGGGLVVGTVRGADRIGLRQISGESKRLADKARAKGLSPEEMADSTFTISNLGMFGVSHFTAIINPPNVAILAVGAAIQRPVVRDGRVEPGWVMSMTMSSDHRVVDGAMAAAYLATVRGLLEKPATLLV